MTVKELIERLSEYPEDAEVTTMNYKGEDVPPKIFYDKDRKFISIFES